MGHGAAQVLLADGLAGDALDDLRAGDEHVGGVLHHEDEVGHGRGIDRAAGGGSHDGRNLRNDPAGDGVAVEDLAVAGQGVHPFLDAGPAGVVETHQRHPGLQGQVHDLADLLGVHLAEAPGPGGEILGEGEDRAAVDLAEAGDHPVRRDLHLFQAEIDRAVGDEHIGFLEGAGIEKEVQALPGGELAAGVLLLHRLGAPHTLDLGLLLSQLLNLLSHCLHNLQLLFGKPLVNQRSGLKGRGWSGIISKFLGVSSLKGIQEASGNRA